MYYYFLKRLLLIIPTLLAIILLNFFIIQTAPGGPVDRVLAQMNQNRVGSESANISGIKTLDMSAASSGGVYNGTRGIDEEIIQNLKKSYGFDLPLWQRFTLMLKKFLQFDFGKSFYQDKDVIDLIKEKMPVSLSLGLWSTFLTYLIAVPLGIKKAVKRGSNFDLWTSSLIAILHAIPAFLLAILFIIIFCGGTFFNIFPLRGMVSSNFSQLDFFHKCLDYLWHMTLPVISMTIGGFASLTFFCKSSFIEELSKSYVVALKARGIREGKILYFYVFRNAMLILVANLPHLLFSMLFAGSMLIEVIFSLDGIGLLGYEATIARDYPVMFSSLYIFTLIGLITNLLGDLIYTIIDPRINFKSR